MKNSDYSEISFSIEPQQILNAYHLAEMKKLEVVGIFHSHPSKPAPSVTDERYMEINPVVWLIYSTTTNQFKAYRFEEEVVDVTLRIKVTE
jgi:proteasome lid subunit RPN8/RPN11